MANVSLSGPTLFAPLIEAASSIAQASQCSQNNQKYTILLILTDGEINDMEATINSIIRASYQPLSIIIVGVGNADFSSNTFFPILIFLILFLIFLHLIFVSSNN